MAITISGENNNDRILASDGVIDQISGINIVGVLTATTFSGDFIGDLTGNVTGNINNSTLLLQTGGYERVRITSTGSVGIGTNNPDVGNTAYPVCQVHVTSTNSYFKLTNTTTGVGIGDGVELSLSGSDAYLTNRESANIIFRT